MKNLIWSLAAVLFLSSSSSALADPAAHSTKRGSEGLDRFGADTYAGKPLVGDFHPIRVSEQVIGRTNPPQILDFKIIDGGLSSGLHTSHPSEAPSVWGYPGSQNAVDNTKTNPQNKKKMDVLLDSEDCTFKAPIIQGKGVLEQKDQEKLPKLFPLQKHNFPAELGW